jgi:site-specific DNA-adenine methylase
MKQQPAEAPQLLATSPETGRIYFAIVVGGAAILLMILAEMKFFGT